MGGEGGGGGRKQTSIETGGTGGGGEKSEVNIKVPRNFGKPRISENPLLNPTEAYWFFGAVEPQKFEEKHLPSFAKRAGHHRHLDPKMTETRVYIGFRV